MLIYRLLGEGWFSLGEITLLAITLVQIWAEAEVLWKYPIKGI